MTESKTPRTDAETHECYIRFDMGGSATADRRKDEHGDCVSADFARTLELELANKTTERDGNWMDKWGACKVCDGEIPDGHMENCDIYKLEKEIRNLKLELAEAKASNAKLRKALKACQTYLAVRHPYDSDHDDCNTCEAHKLANEALSTTSNKI